LVQENLSKALKCLAWSWWKPFRAGCETGKPTIGGLMWLELSLFFTPH
jgi:hypothetical protein